MNTLSRKNRDEGASGDQSDPVPYAQQSDGMLDFAPLIAVASVAIAMLVVLLIAIH